MKKLISLLLVLCMVLGMSVSVWAADVSTADALIEKLENGEDVVMTTDIKIDPANMSNAYGKTGINVQKGQTIDGGNYTLDIKGAGGTWDSGINTTGGLIKNLTVTGSFRGIFINHNSEYSEPVVLDNVTIDGTTYTISCDQGKNQGLIATNCTFNGWTSYAATLGSATFTNCNFGEGNGYAFCRPYAPTTFTNCHFEEGFKLDAKQNNNNVLIDCYYGDTLITEENISSLLGSGADNAKVQPNSAPSIGGGILVDNGNEAGICYEIVGAKVGEKHTYTVELYANSQLLVTKELEITAESGTLTCSFYTVGTSSSWKQSPSPWSAWDDTIPTHAVLYVDGQKTSVDDEIEFTKEEWIAFPGTQERPAPTPTPDDTDDDWYYEEIEEDDDTESLVVRIKFDGVDEADFEEIKVNLLKNGKKYDSEELSASKVSKKDWRFEWDNLDEDDDWSVALAAELDGYDAEVVNLRGNYWTITLTPAEVEAPVVSVDKTNPDTGAHDFVGAAVALAVVSSIGAVALSKRR